MTNETRPTKKTYHVVCFDGSEWTVKADYFEVGADKLYNFYEYIYKFVRFNGWRTDRSGHYDRKPSTEISISDYEKLTPEEQTSFSLRDQGRRFVGRIEAVRVCYPVNSSGVGNVERIK